MSDFIAGGADADTARWGIGLNELDDTDAWATEWADCVRKGNGIWGGRSRGGRGVRGGGSGLDVSVDGVTLAFCGKPLLNSSRLVLSPLSSKCICDVIMINIYAVCDFSMVVATVLLVRMVTCQ